MLIMLIGRISVTLFDFCWLMAHSDAFSSKYTPSGHAFIFIIALEKSGMDGIMRVFFEINRSGIVFHFSSGMFVGWKCVV